jgi:hypothetical protein
MMIDEQYYGMHFEELTKKFAEVYGIWIKINVFQKYNESSPL